MYVSHPITIFRYLNMDGLNCNTEFLVVWRAYIFLAVFIAYNPLDIYNRPFHKLLYQ